MLLTKIQDKISQINQRLKAKTWSDKSIVYYTGHTPYQWSPKSLDSGLGGADARIIYLSREWVKLGYSVTVFINCGVHEGIYDGVNYQNYTKFNPFDRFDTLIMWQFAWRLSKNTKTNRLWLDLGSVLLPEEVTADKLEHYDRIFCKNSYHRSLLPEIEDSKIAIIPNGIDKKFIGLKDNSKDLNKIIYASNYIRGLEKMLEYGWPIIKREISSAQLFIYYGWNEKTDSETKNKITKLMEQPGVKEMGKVGRGILMKEKSTSAINYYGCTFQELDCNTVRESALVGCVPVTTNYAGLQDKTYCLKISGNPHLQETQENLAYKIVELLKNPEQLRQISLKFSELVKYETWENVAKLWLDEIES